MITSTDRQVLCSHVHLQVLEEVVVLGHTQYNHTITVAVNPGHGSGTHYMTITVNPCYSTESRIIRQVMILEQTLQGNYSFGDKHYKAITVTVNPCHDPGTLTRQLVMVMIMGQTLQGNYSFLDKH